MAIAWLAWYSLFCMIACGGAWALTGSSAVLAATLAVAALAPFISLGTMGLVLFTARVGRGR
jgi:hypothetical protein